jgi:hypothetical protein
MKRIKVCKEADCAYENECFVPGGKLEQRKKWIHSHDLFLDDTGRVFALVDTETRVFFMDAMTGSLYEFGNCLTGSLEIKNLRRNKEKATDILMSKKGE